MSNEQHYREIIIALFNPASDGHAKDCLANERGPCQCGCAKIAGRYLWALREAKKIASEVHGNEAVEASRRLKEPKVLVLAEIGHSQFQIRPLTN